MTISFKIKKNTNTEQTILHDAAQNIHNGYINDATSASPVVDDPETLVLNGDVKHFNVTMTNSQTGSVNNYKHFVFNYESLIEKIHFVKQNISDADKIQLFQKHSNNLKISDLSDFETNMLMTEGTDYEKYYMKMSDIEAKAATEAQASNYDSYVKLKNNIKRNIPFFIYNDTKITLDNRDEKWQIYFVNYITKSNSGYEDITKYSFKIENSTSIADDTINYYRSRILIVGGGGSGGYSVGGGGGGGQVIYINDILLSDNKAYELAVGGGGIQNTHNSKNNIQGKNSYFNNIYSLGGGNGVSLLNDATKISYDNVNNDLSNTQYSEGANSGGYCGLQYGTDGPTDENYLQNSRIDIKKNISNPLQGYDIFNISKNKQGGNSYKLNDITDNIIIRGGGGGGSGYKDLDTEDQKKTYYESIDSYENSVETSSNGRGNGCDGISIKEFNSNYCNIIANYGYDIESHINRCSYQDKNALNNGENQLYLTSSSADSERDTNDLYFGAGGGGGGYNTNLLNNKIMIGGKGGKGGGGYGGIFTSDTTGIQLNDLPLEDNVNGIFKYLSTFYNKINDRRLNSSQDLGTVNKYVTGMLAKGGDGYPNTGSGGGGGGLFGMGGNGGSGIVILSVELNKYVPSSSSVVTNQKIQDTEAKFDRYKYDLGKNLGIIYNYNINTNENKNFFYHIEKIYNNKFNNDASKSDDIDVDILSLPHNYNIKQYDIKLHLFIYIIYQLKMNYKSFLYYKFNVLNNKYEENDNITDYILIIKILRLIFKSMLDKEYFENIENINNNNKIIILYNGYNIQDDDDSKLLYDNVMKKIKVIHDNAYNIYYDDEDREIKSTDIIIKKKKLNKIYINNTSQPTNEEDELKNNILTYLNKKNLWDFDTDLTKKIFLIYTKDIDYNTFSNVDTYIEESKVKSSLDNYEFFNVKYIISLYLLIINTSNKYNYYKLLYSLYFFMTFTDYLSIFYKKSEEILIGNLKKSPSTLTTEDIIKKYEDTLEYLNETIFTYLNNDITNFKKSKEIHFDKMMDNYIIEKDSYKINKNGKYIQIIIDNTEDIQNFILVFQNTNFQTSEISKYNTQFINIIKYYVIKYEDKEYELKEIKIISSNKIIIVFHDESNKKDYTKDKNIYILLKNTYMNEKFYKDKINKLENKNNEIIKYKKNLEKIKEKNIDYNNYNNNFNLKKNIYYFILFISLIIILALHTIKIENSNKNIVIMFIILLIVGLIIYNNYTTSNINDITSDNIEKFVDKDPYFSNNKILFEISESEISTSLKQITILGQNADDSDVHMLDDRIEFFKPNIYEKLKYLNIYPRNEDSTLTIAEQNIKKTERIEKMKNYITNRYKKYVELHITINEVKQEKIYDITNVEYYTDDDFVYIKALIISVNLVANPDFNLASDTIIKSIKIIDKQKTIINNLLEDIDIYRDYSSYSTSPIIQSGGSDVCQIITASIQSDTSLDDTWIGDKIVYNLNSCDSLHGDYNLNNCIIVKKQNMYQINLLKNNFINNMNNKFIEINELLNIIENNDKNKYNENINDALKYEKINYDIYEQEYSLKKKHNKNVNNLLKHDIVNSTNLLNILLVIYLILLLILLLINIFPDAYILILSIGLILIIVNIGIYTINIKRNTRRNVEKKYFEKYF